MTLATSDRIIFFGTDAFSVPALIRLLAEEWNIVAVVTKPDSRTGRGQDMTPPAVKRLAQASHIEVLQPANLTEIEDKIGELKPDLGIVVAYGKIIPVHIMEMFPDGLINIHPSLLPLYRGATPIESALLNGDDATGVTLMKLDHGMDTGPTYDAAKVQLGGTETRPEMYEHLAEMGAELLSAKLPSILNGTIVPIPQDSAQAIHVSRINKSDGEMDWNKSAAVLEREVRAYQGWPGSRTKIAGTDVTVTASHVSTKTGSPGTAYVSASSELAVYANPGSLVIDRLKPSGKREMTGIEFMTGHPIK